MVYKSQGKSSLSLLEQEPPRNHESHKI